MTTAAAPIDPAPARRARTRHIEMLVVAVLVIVLSLILRVRDDGRVAFAGLDRYPLPETCLAKQLFGVTCPGCGLTRSFIHLAHGNWAQSLQCHRIGWIMALAVLLQIPYRLVSLARGAPALGERFPRFVGGALIVLLIANWLMQW